MVTETLPASPPGAGGERAGLSVATSVGSSSKWCVRLVRITRMRRCAANAPCSTSSCAGIHATPCHSEPGQNTHRARGGINLSPDPKDTQTDNAAREGEDVYRQIDRSYLRQTTSLPRGVTEAHSTRTTSCGARARAFALTQPLLPPPGPPVSSERLQYCPSEVSNTVVSRGTPPDFSSEAKLT